MTREDIQQRPDGLSAQSKVLPDDFFEAIWQALPASPNELDDLHFWSPYTSGTLIPAFDAQPFL